MPSSLDEVSAYYRSFQLSAILALVISAKLAVNATSLIVEMTQTGHSRAVFYGLTNPILQPLHLLQLNTYFNDY